MKLSILMPVFNEERYLPEALKQALAVDYGSDVEFVVVDDGSTDSTPDILAAVDDPRVRVVRQPRNIGKGDRAVTTAANVAFNCYLSDLETCLKLMPLPLYRSLRIRSRGFGMEAEVTCKLLRCGIRPFEMSVSYAARTRAEHKKITWKDGVEALWIIGRARVRRRTVDPSTTPQAPTPWDTTQLPGTKPSPADVSEANPPEPTSG